MADKLSCDACGATFTSKAELDKHVNKEHMQPSEPTAPGRPKEM